MVRGFGAPILSMVTFLAVTCLLFSDLIYLKTGFGSVSLFLLIAPLLVLILLFIKRRFCAARMVVIAYAFNLFLIIYTAIGIFIYNRPTLAIQFVSIFVSAFLFLNLGYFGNRHLIAKLLVGISIVAVFFAFSQFANFTIGYRDPFSVFERLSALIVDAQTDLGVEVLYGRSSGIFTSPNILGLFGGLSFWLIIYLKDYLSSAYFRLGVGASVVCIIFSISRGSLFAYLASIFVFFVTSLGLIGRERRGLVFRGSLFLLIAAILFYINIDIFSETQVGRFMEMAYVVKGDFESSENAIGRVENWLAIVNHISEKPFGTILPPQIIINHSPDNQFVYYFAQGGGLLLFIVVIFYLYLIYLVVGKKNINSKILLAVLVFLIINSMTIVVMNGFVFMLFWMLVGMYSRDN